MSLNPETEPLAIIKGQPLLQLPDNLYIPPEALQVFLEAFSGPLDLLLYLIRKQNIDILDIPIARITEQYMQYVDMMKILQLDLAAEYLVMAAMLAEIKSRLLLPKPVELDDAETDPRMELMRRLQEYERFKTAAEQLDQIPTNRDFFMAMAEASKDQSIIKVPNLSFQDLMQALNKVLTDSRLRAHHHISREVLSVRERMIQIVDQLQQNKFIEFTRLFNFEEGRAGVVVTFIAMLELLKQSMIEIIQAELFSTIHIKMVEHVNTE